MRNTKAMTKKAVLICLVLIVAIAMFTYNKRTSQTPTVDPYFDWQSSVIENSDKSIRITLKYPKSSYVDKQPSVKNSME